MDKQRTLERFNGPQNNSLYDFLAYYGGIPLELTNPKHSVELVDYTNSNLTLNYCKADRIKTTVIPFTPPLKSEASAATRLELMSFEAADAFRVSPYRAKEYLYPAPSGVAVIATVAAGIVLSISPKNSYRLLFRRFPRLATFVRDRLRTVIVGLLLVHAWEYATFLRPKLDKFRVFGFLRLRWFVTCLFEGFPSWVRFYKYADALTKKRRQFESENH